MADETEPVEPVEGLLAAGRQVLDEARQTIADLDAAMNTAVLPIIVTGEAAPE